MESKASEGKDDRSDTFIVEELVKFTNTSNYVNKVQDFMLDNCRGFESYRDQVKSGEGNKLEWMDLFRDYQELVDAELGNFCEQHEVEPSEVFTSIERYLSDSADEEFIPLFLKTMNEEHFFEQMHSYASEARRDNTVEEVLQNEEKGESSMSGIYHLEPESLDKDEIDSWLDVMRLPWPFKKMFKSAHKRPMKATIVHISQVKFEICIAVPFFGNMLFDVKLNGEWCTGMNRLGQPIKLRGEEQDNGDVILYVKDRGGSLMMIFMSMTSPSTIRMYREFYSGGEDLGAQSADAVLTCNFRK